MNLRDLQYVVTVSELQSFSQAAEQCHVSQPTLSNQIKKLEDYLNIAIFERTNKRVMLTQAGSEIVNAARKMLREAENIREIAAGARDPLAGKFRLGAFPTLSPYLFPEIVPELKSHFPDLRLILIEEKTSDLLTRLKSGEIDAALLALPVQDDQFLSTPLFDDPFLLAVPDSHILAKKQDVTLNDLHQGKLMLLEEGHCLRDQALDVCHLQDFPVEEDFYATSLETLRQMVRAGTGMTFMPRIAISSMKDHTGISYIPFKEPAPFRTIGLVWRKTSVRKELIKQMVDMIKKTVISSK